VRCRTTRRRGGSRITRNRSSPGEGRRISGLPSSPCSRRNISIQGRDEEGDSPFRDGPGNCLLSQRGRGTVLGKLLPGGVFSEQGKFEDAQTRLEHAKSHAVNNPYLLARAMDQQAWLWGLQRRFEDAKSEALRALDAFEKLGAANDAETTRQLLHAGLCDPKEGSERSSQ
jgi:hypothetical protein